MKTYKIDFNSFCFKMQWFQENVAPLADNLYIFYKISIKVSIISKFKDQVQGTELRGN